MSRWMRLRLFTMQRGVSIGGASDKERPLLRSYQTKKKKDQQMQASLAFLPFVFALRASPHCLSAAVIVELPGLEGRG